MTLADPPSGNGFGNGEAETAATAIAPASRPGAATASSADAAVAAPVRVLWLIKGLGPGGAERLLVGTARSIDRERFDVSAAYLLPWKDHLVGELREAGVDANLPARAGRPRPSMDPAAARARSRPADPARARALAGGRRRREGRAGRADGHRHDRAQHVGSLPAGDAPAELGHVRTTAGRHRRLAGGRTLVRAARPPARLAAGARDPQRGRRGRRARGARSIARPRAPSWACRRTCPSSARSAA